MVDFSPLAVLGIIIIIGLASRRSNLLKDEHINALPALLFNIAYPALILTSVTSVDINRQAYESIVVVVSTLIITLILYFVGLLALKNYKTHERKPVLIFNLAVGNITFVLLPVMQAAFGDIGVYYAILHGSTQDILIWTIYYRYFKSDGGRNSIKLKNMINLCSIALLVALIFRFLDVQFQGIINDALRLLSGLTTPLALIYIGGVLGKKGDLKRWRLDKDIIVMAVTKIIILPFIIYGIMLLMPISNYLRILIAFVFSAPAPLMSTVWAKEFNCDYEFSIRFLFFSTFLFFVAMLPFFLLKEYIIY